MGLEWVLLQQYFSSRTSGTVNDFDLGSWSLDLDPSLQLLQQQTCEWEAGSTGHVPRACRHQYNWLSGICWELRKSGNLILGIGGFGQPFFSGAERNDSKFIPHVVVILKIMRVKCLYLRFLWPLHPFRQLVVLWVYDNKSPKPQIFVVVPVKRPLHNRPSEALPHTVAYNIIIWLEILLFKKIITLSWNRFTYSTVNSCSPTGMQYTNWRADHSRWNSVHSSTFITLFAGGGPTQIGSFKNSRTRFRITSNIDNPQHRRSFVNKSPSAARLRCFSVPYFSMFSIIWSAAYFCSRRFCLFSNFSFSEIVLINGLC